MINLYTRPYFYYLDYLLLITGFIFFIMGTLIYIFSKQRKKTIRSNLKFYIIFLILNGLSIWSEFLLTIFPERDIFQKTETTFHLVAYIFLLEFGRRMVLYNKKRTAILVYLPFILLFFLNIPMTLIHNWIALIGSLLIGIGLWLWLEEMDQKDYLNTKNKKSLPLLFILLSLVFLTDSLIYLFFQDLNFLNRFHMTKHFLEWSLLLITTWVALINILRLFTYDPIAMQLKRIKIRLVKIVTIILIVLTVTGFFALLSIGKLSFENDRQDMLDIVKYAALGIDGDLHQQLYTRQHNLQDSVYQTILKKLRNIKNQSNSINEIYTMFLKEDNLVFAVDGNIEPGDTGNHLGDLYEGTPMMSAVIRNGNAMVEEEIDSDQWGGWLSAYAPVKNKAGDTVALLGIDMQAERVLYHIKIYRLIGIIFLLMNYFIIAVLAYLYYINKKESVWRLYHSKILSTIGDIVGVFDKSKRLIYVNDAAFKLAGGSPKVNLTKLSLKDFLLEKDYQRLNDILSHLKEDKPEYAEFTLKNIYGDLIPVYASLSYLENIQGEPLYVFTAMNISEQKMREEDIKTNFKNFLSLIATVIDAKDGYTALHSANVARYAKIIAAELGFSDEKIKEIETAAFVHDIGKVGIPDSVLKKKDKLSAVEWEEMKKHPEYGKLILEKAGETFKHLIPYVYYHHERYDGKGYPTGMKKPPIPISIILVADAFDAMTSDRSYRKALPIEKAKEELLKHSGTQFHPEVVKAFLQAIDNIDYRDKVTG